MKRVIRKLLNRCRVEVSRRSWDRHRDAFVRLQPEGPVRGKVLLAYIIDPFLRAPSEPISSSHTHFGESDVIARTFLDLGYSVDAISYRNDVFVPRDRYSFFFSARTNFQRIAERLNPDCIKVAHLDMAHWLFNNSAALNRCLDLQRRRGVTLRSHKMQDENFAIEYADCATVLGNDFTLGTYSYARKKMYRLPLPCCSQYPWPEEKDFEACRRRFVWFGSHGLVHKGLDLALEAFAGMPEHHLTVCAPLEREPRFKEAYHRELFETPNIETLGWVEVESPGFLEMTRRCAGLVYPSCSEGMSGAVVTCMQAGLIPLVTFESGVDIDAGFGRVLSDSTVEGIRNSVRSLSCLPSETLARMSQCAWQEARRRYTRKNYAKDLQRALEEILFDFSQDSEPRTRAVS